VPRIPDEFLDCVVYIYPSLDAAHQGSRVGGTGFLIAVPRDPDTAGATYIATNSHVAEEGSAVRLTTTAGGTEVVALNLCDWNHHPAGDDVAIIALPPATSGWHVKRLPTTYFLTRKEVMDYNVGPGDNVYFMGRFIPHEGKHRNLPVVRFGTIAMMPGEPVYQTKRKRYQESFVVEGRSLSGLSGSPVMLHIPPFSNRFTKGIHAPDAAGLKPETTTGLLGLDWGSLLLGDEARTNSGMMGVVPVWKLWDLIRAIKV
jgi:hypothetical protein